MFTTLFALTAFILMWIGGIRCNFLKFTSTSGADEPFTFEMGMWYYSYYSLLFSTSGTYLFESCNPYSSLTPIDATWKTAYAFGIITFILAVVMLVLMCVTGCSYISDYDKPQTSRFEGPAYLLITICQGLVLLLLSSNACNSMVIKTLGVPALDNVEFEETCGLATGAKLVISATVFWFSAAVSSFMAHKAEKQELGGDDGEAEKPAEAAAEEGEAKPEQEEAVPEQAVAAE